MPDWTRAEVEATVADYFDMLEQEIRGQEYNKSAHRRTLSRLLNERSDAAIERKHQNVSAVLIALGFIPISGYKPLGNYQRLLFEVVEDRLTSNTALIAEVARQVVEPATVPTVDEILEAMVEPPTREGNRGYSSIARDSSTPRSGVDYLSIESRNRSLGESGEVFVMRFEVARLLRAGKDRLASRVEHVSQTQGDGLGYDIRSFEDSGEDRLIEVKTTRYGPWTPFFVTRRELTFSAEAKERFHLYRTFDFRRQPKLFCKSGPIEQAFALRPTQFIATIQ